MMLILVLSLIACGRGERTTDSLISEEASWEKMDDFDQKVNVFEDENRDIWQKPDRIIDLLGPLEGKTIVDLGAASGYFSFRILPKAGKVIAVDIDPRFIGFLKEKKQLLPADQIDKFEVRLAQSDDPRLIDQEADAILLVSTYVYIEDRINYFSRLRSKLSDEGKIVIIEFKKKQIPNGPPDEEKVALSQVERELREAGYSNISTDDTTLDYQYIITARVK